MDLFSRPSKGKRRIYGWKIKKQRSNLKQGRTFLFMSIIDQQNTVPSEVMTATASNVQEKIGLPFEMAGEFLHWADG